MLIRDAVVLKIGGINIWRSFVRDNKCIYFRHQNQEELQISAYQNNKEACAVDIVYFTKKPSKQKVSHAMTEALLPHILYHNIKIFIV